MADHQVWIMPVAADDIVHVTEQVISYEVEGTLHLGKSVGTVNDDGVNYEMVVE
jgi:hypothetical protein